MPIDLSDPKYYENRELSWIKFNRRVLNEAVDKNVPLLEKLKFTAITSSNLDEFFMVRVASLKDMENAGVKKTDIAGMTPSQQLAAVELAVREMVDIQYSNFNRSIIPMLKKNNIIIHGGYEELTAEQKEAADAYFDEFVFPVLTPMAVDASRPFPLIRNRTLNIAAMVKKNKQSSFATVQVPNGLPRAVKLTANDGVFEYILLEDLIIHHMDRLFLGHEILTVCPYRIMRDADFELDEDEAADLLQEIEKKLKKRQWGEVIRLEVRDDIDKSLLKYLKKELNITDDEIFRLNGPLDLTFLMKLYGLEGKDELRYPSHTPAAVPEFKEDETIFDSIKRNDIFVHHPYQSFDPVVRFIRDASVDPDVLAIKQTLYRVSGNSPIIAALAHAAESGKQVTVLVELKARFDEENNIVWARKLEQAGCHVIYGLVGLKTHSKIALVVRREEEGIVRYVHLGTGNYNDSTAKLYTDCGIFTCNEAIGEDATAVFNMLSGYCEPASWNHLIVAPLWLRKKFISLIKRETKHALEGKKAYIKAKMNSLCDKEIIEALYEASNAGVQIDLVVRGICCLRAGLPGVSENIRVRSIVGFFLEHSRIFIFGNNGREEIYMGSADWMPRNLDKRVEIVFPVLNDDLKEKVTHIIDVELQDNKGAYILGSDGEYTKVSRGRKPLIGSQRIFADEAEELARPKKNRKNTRVFTPVSSK